MTPTIAQQQDDDAALQAAKQSFLAAIQQGMEALQECGYSRERATAVLMRELQRVSQDDKKQRRELKALHPTDQEVSSGGRERKTASRN